MKKIVVFIFALFYLSVSTGATVHLSYCMGRLVSKGLFHHESKRCSRCGMDKDKAGGCCKDESVQIKLANDQATPATALDKLPVFTSVIATVEGIFQVESYQLNKQFFQNISPPVNDHVPVYLRNCVFRI